MKKMTSPSIGSQILAAAVLLMSLGGAARAGEDDWLPLGADDNFGVWHQPTGDWYVAGDATLDPNNSKRLAGKPGAGVMINGRTGRTRSLVTRRRDFRDVELHVEFMVAKGSNSGVIFHGNHEIQILDSHGIEKPTAGHCGGIYPQAEAKPTYHHIGGGSPPRVNAAKPPGQWQTLDIIFQAARFDEAGEKTAHARFVRVVHNGLVIQENQEVPYASGTNWDRKQFPQGPIIFQGDYGPVAFRNIRVRPWQPGAEELNVPLEGFTALFNGRDLSGWRVPPKVKQFWSVEDGVLKSHGLLREWGACLATEKEYRDFVLLVDFRFPALSDSGINFRRLLPDMGNFGRMEQFNLRSKGGMGHLESFYFMPKDVKEKMALRETDLPHVRYIDPEVGVWHTVKLTVIGKNVTAEYDGEVIIDHFEYPDGILSMEPAIIRFQKHVFVNGDNLGEMNPCPIEYRNIFIKEIESSELNVPPEGFTALFNGKDFTDWHLSPMAKKAWFIENGVLKSHAGFKDWGADLVTEREYRDFVLLVDFRIPTISDSGIWFRGWKPLGQGSEQFNIRSRGGMGQLESFHQLPPDIQLEDHELPPPLKYIDPEVGVWHTIKLTLIGKTLSAEYDGEIILDRFEYPEGILSMEPGVIRLQKHAMTEIAGKMNDCPIEFRNIFIKEIEAGLSATMLNVSEGKVRVKRLSDGSTVDGSPVTLRVPSGPATVGL